MLCEQHLEEVLRRSTSVVRGETDKGQWDVCVGFISFYTRETFNNK